MEYSNIYFNNIKIKNSAAVVAVDSMVNTEIKLSSPNRSPMLGNEQSSSVNSVGDKATSNNNKVTVFPNRMILIFEICENGKL